MKPKPFLMLVFGAAFVGWLVLFLLLGPTGYSREFNKTTFTFNGHEYPRKIAHDHYLSITKSGPYKLYQERPALHPPEPGHNPDLAALGIPHLTEGELEFVEAYEAQPIFQAEQTRQFWFNFLINVLNASLFCTLVWRFASAPLGNMLAEKVASVRQLLEAAEGERAHAEERLGYARTALEGLTAERARVKEDVDTRVERELAELAEANAQSLALFEQETEDRKAKEMHAAAMMVKRELVNESINRVIAKLREDASPDDQASWLNELARELERRPS